MISLNGTLNGNNNLLVNFFQNGGSILIFGATARVCCAAVPNGKKVDAEIESGSVTILREQGQPYCGDASYTGKNFTNESARSIVGVTLTIEGKNKRAIIVKSAHTFMTSKLTCNKGDMLCYR